MSGRIPAAHRDNGHRPRVLVVDDDDAICELVRQALSDQGYAVATVPHGAAALEMVKHHQPAVLLVDLRMPIMDGWAFVEQYRRVAGPPASIVLLSAVKDLEETARRLGCEGFVQKPFDLDEVTAAVQRCIPAT
ncbi:MAG: response regulator [Candidatus Limnocylindria bacterium]